MAYHHPLAKVQYDIKRGMKMKAAVRLRTLINLYPQEIQWRSDLAEMYYEAGFLDAAGLYWMLDEPAESHMAECVALYEASVNNSPLQILKDIKFRGEIADLPVYAKEKLKALEVAKREIEEHTREFSRKHNVLRPAVPESFKDKVISKVGCFFTCMFVVFVAAVILSGLGEVFGFIKELFVDLLL